jgi:hypothetical protein
MTEEDFEWMLDAFNEALALQESMVEVSVGASMARGAFDPSVSAARRPTWSSEHTRPCSHDDQPGASKANTWPLAATNQ